MCYSAAVIWLSALGKLSLIASKLLSLLVQLRTKIYLEYNYMTLVIRVTNWDRFLLFMYINVVHLRLQETITRNMR